jgi:MarR family transcriptional regulator, lower aerobic nicotinate degradation pathway regulator
MQSRYKLLQQILDYLDEFQSGQNNSDNLEEFVFYLKDKVFDIHKKKEWTLDADFSDPQCVNTTDVPEVELSTLVATLYRFAKNYTKKAFEKTSFKSLDEFGFMASLFKHRSMHKSELIHMHMMEISSGSEIIRRLIKLGLIREVRDEFDKRAKSILLTEKGEIEIILAFAEMNKVAKIISGNLSTDELNETIYVLNKLKIFHETIHQHDKGEEMNHLLDKYIEKAG